MENPEGWGGGYSLLQKTENPGKRGVLSEIPSVVGVWIFSGTTQYIKRLEHAIQIKFFLKHEISNKGWFH